MLGCGPNDTSTSEKIFVADGFGRAGLLAGRHEDVDRLPAVLRLGEHVAERDVVQQVPVVVDGEPVDRVGMKRIGVRVRVEDQHRAVGVGGGLECVKVAEVESLVAQGRPEAEAGEVVGHDQTVHPGRSE